MKIYVAGKVTDIPGYRDHFAREAAKLRAEGHAVMSPDILPDGFDYEDYMLICFAMIDVCDGVYLLSNWKESKGARREFIHAKRVHKLVFYER